MVIKSILDNDLYKFTMQNFVVKRYPNILAEYKFYDRDQRIRPNEAFLEALKKNVNSMGDLKLTSDENDFLKRTLPFFDVLYRAYLKNFRYNPSNVHISVIEGFLHISIKGLWRDTILWEVPLMAMISELYFKHIDTSWNKDYQVQEKTASVKAEKLSSCIFVDFGTRRRRDYNTQDLVVREMKKVQGFVGTSNVHLAQKHNVKAIGTQAHELVQAHSALESLRHANRYMMQNWVKIYGQDNLGIVLTDTYGLDAFLRDFNPFYARYFDGVRHDSGDPYKFTDQIVKHYQTIGINPKEKTIVFSDGLTVKKALELQDYCKDKIKCSFGIGTHFTNDYEGSKALNIVIKLHKINDIPVVKLSDTPSKAVGEKDAVKIAKWTFFGEALC